jgi:hypothetical protein
MIGLKLGFLKIKFENTIPSLNPEILMILDFRSKQLNPHLYTQDETVLFIAEIINTIIRRRAFIIFIHIK